MKYPETITADMLPTWAHASDDDLSRDLADTELEILAFGMLRDAELVIARVHPNPNERHIAAFKADARPAQIAEREHFVAFLKRLRSARMSVTLVEVQS